jgi:hypothetical protein
MGRATSGRDLNIDPQLFQEVFVELFANAFQHDRGKAHWLQEPESAMGGSCSASTNQKRFSLRKRKIGDGNRSATSDRDIMAWSEPRPRYHRSARRRVAGSIRSQSRDARFDNGTPDVEPAIRTWLNLMAFSQFKQLQPTARA